MKKIVLLIALFMASPAFANEYTFTMEEAVLRALEANPQKSVAKNQVEASKSALYAARSAFGPSLDAGYAITHDPVSDKVKNFVDETTYAVSLTLSQPLFTGFNLLNTAQKAKLEVERQKLQLSKTEINIATNVQATFLQYLMAVESVASSLQSLERAKVQLQTATSGYEIGLRPKIDVLQAQYDMTATEATLIENENNRESFRAQLNSLLNIPVESNTNYVGTLNVIPYQIEFNTAVKKAFEQLPDVQMAQISLEQVEKDLNITKGAFLPMVYANLEYIAAGSDWDASGELRSRRSLTFPQDELNPRENTTFGLTASMNLFKSGQKYFQVKQAKSIVESLVSEVELTFNTAALNVKTSLIELQDASRTVEVAERALDSASQSYEDAKIRYESQLGTNLEMLTAQSDLADAELSFISSKANYLIALSSLYASLGEVHPSLDEEDIFMLSK